MNKHELEERLLNYALMNIEITNEIPSSKAGNHLSNQLVHSGTSPTLNYRKGHLCAEALWCEGTEK